MQQVAPRYCHVVVACPARAVTGGPEALHQLVDAINSLGGRSSIWYRGHDAASATTPDAYRSYNTPRVVDPEIGPHDALVAAETQPEQLMDDIAGSKIFWWLSVDNYIRHVRAIPGPVRARWRHRMWRFRGTDGRVGWERAISRAVLRRWPQAAIRRNWIHAAQSAYAREFASRMGLTAHMLTDYISASHIADGSGTDAGRHIIAYNPAKGAEFTARIRSECRDITFVPIERMTSAEVAALLRRATVYIDFGEHPGRDRIPREAALHGAIVVVGRRGSAAFEEDCPLPDRYRVDMKRFDVTATCDLLRAVMADPAPHLTAQVPYREWVGSQRITFYHEVAELFFSPMFQR